MESDHAGMQRALEAGREGIEQGQTPFGACIVRADEVLTAAHNNVWGETDITAHAEICTLRRACRVVGNIHLTGTTIYSTTEPCPMCFAAIHWAGITRIVFGARIADAAHYGFNELQLSNTQLKEMAGLETKILPDFMREEALMLFEQWSRAGGKPY